MITFFETANVNASDEVVFDFLSDINNLLSFIPKEDPASIREEMPLFGVESLHHLQVVSVERTPTMKIHMDTIEKKPLRFELVLDIKPLEEELTELTATFHAHVRKIPLTEEIFSGIIQLICYTVAYGVKIKIEKEKAK